jgi:hypothetical protein
MGVADLKIQVGADVSQAAQGLAGLNQTLSELETELNLIGRAIDVATSKGQDISKLEDAWQKTNDRIKDMKASLQTLPTAPVTTLTNEVGDLGKKVEQTGNGIVGVAGNAYSAIRKLAYILPGIGVAGLIGGISNALIDLFRNSSKEAEEAIKVNKEYFSTFGKVAGLNLDQAKEEIKEYQKIVASSVDSTGKEAAQVDILVSRLRDGNLSRQQTVDVIKKLQSIAPDYFSKLNAEKATIDDVAAAYQRYNQALVASIEAQIHVAEITDLVKKRLDFARQSPDAAKFINELLAKGKSLDDISKVISDDFRKQNDALIRVGQSQKANSAEVEKQALLTSKVPLGVSSLLDYLRKEQDLLKEINNAPLKDIGVNTKTGNIDELKRELENLQKFLSFLKSQPQIIPIKIQENDTEIKILRDKIALLLRDGIKDGLSPDQINIESKALQKALDEALRANPARAHLQPIADIDDKELKKFAEDSGKLLTDRMHHLPPIKSDVAVQLTFTDFEKYQQDYKKKLDKLQKSFTDDVRDFSRSIQEQFAVDVGKALGDALTGKGIQNAFNDFMQFLGSAIQKLGEQLIAVSGVFAAIDISLGNLLDNPALAAAAGIAAVAVGEAVKNSFKVKAFADGGIITGPTLGLVGEAGPEAIFPLNQLNRFIKNNTTGNASQVTVQGVVRGRDLALVMARDSKNQNLVQ